MKVKYEMGYGETVMLPAHYEVCGRCHGSGVHDCWEGGVTQEMSDDPDFFEDYASGMYDAGCTECEGKRVVAVIDRDQMSEELRERYDEHEREKYDYAMEVAAERRFFGG
jgi:hypothetical protein